LSSKVTVALKITNALVRWGGWTVGIGGEYAFLDWLTGFIEYDHYGFGDNDNGRFGCGFACPVGTFGAFPGDFRTDVDVVKAGLNVSKSRRTYTGHRAAAWSGGNGSRVGLRIALFEACSAFTRVTACTLALSPYIVTRYPKASATSLPP
jgi:hypothetical protein